MTEHKLFIGGKWLEGTQRLPVRDKFTGEELATVALGTPGDVDRAATAAVAAFRDTPFPPYHRYEVLSKASRLVSERREAIVGTMVRETGFPVQDAEADWKRAVQTLLLSAEEAKRITGDMVPLDGAPGGENRLGFTLRMPLGPVCAITPFNSPLNTVAHKLGPALAAGNSVVLKPATYTPLSAIALCQILEEAGVPPGYLNLVIGSGGEVGEALLTDGRFRFYTFTGSTEVGKRIQRTIGLRRSQLELGNISATIIAEDADLDRATAKIPKAAFRKAGQVCTSVQRVLTPRKLVERLAERLGARAQEMPVGDPTAAGIEIGPMIHEQEAARAESWVHEAVRQGATALGEIHREGPLLWPVVLKDVRSEMDVVSKEIFAPVISLIPFDSLDEAIRVVNSTPFGLTAGIFTGSVRVAMQAARGIEAGVVQINETSSSRVDLMPYGGVKDSGFGREGPYYAIREMTEERLVIFNLD
jgi:acyl-CoA reductase-like NAD-dependent aldehyde dehydrogenase